MIREKVTSYLLSRIPANQIIAYAQNIIRDTDYMVGESFTDPAQTKQFFSVRFRGLEHEVFACAFLDNRNRLICVMELFRGTINGASVYPREVIKEALAVNAAAVIFAHNHPSGIPEPSDADRRITDKLKTALDYIDIRALDHIVVGNSDSISFAERGLI